MSMGSGVPSSSAQGQTYAIAANVATQIPVGEGITVINSGGTVITLGTDEHFANSTVSLPGQASLPWPPGPGGVLYAFSPTATSLIVVQGLYNYWNPSSVTIPASPTALLPPTPMLGGTFQATVPLTSTTRTLIIIIGAENTTAGLRVLGSNSDYPYFATPAEGLQGPYLVTANGNGFHVVPVDPAIDSAVLINAASAGTGPISVFGDSLSYDETRFYNGSRLQVASQSLAVTTGVNVLAGPARLLTASVEAFPSTTGFLTIGGTVFLRQDTQVGQGAYAPSITFPPNTVIGFGQTVALSAVTSGNAVVGSVTYAYP